MTPKKAGYFIDCQEVIYHMSPQGLQGKEPSAARTMSLLQSGQSWKSKGCQYLAAGSGERAEEGLSSADRVLRRSCSRTNAINHCLPDFISCPHID